MKEGSLWTLPVAQGNNANARTVSLRVMNDLQPTPAQLAEAEQLFERHLFLLRTSLVGFNTRHFEMSDGSKVRFVSNSGQHLIELQPVGGGGLVYDMRPVFAANGPSYGSAWPIGDLADFATWRGLPFNTATPPTLKHNVFKKHPGNQCWFTNDKTSPNYGLVLSWWGLSKNRYGEGWVRDGTSTAEPDASPGGTYNDIWCNGVKLATISFSLSNAIYGACITAVDDGSGNMVPTIAVLVCLSEKNTYSPISGHPSRTTFNYGAGSLDDTGFTHFIPGSNNIGLYHAKLPAKFRQGEVGPLSFTRITLLEFDDATPTSQPSLILDGSATTSYSVEWRPTEGARFNSSGTEGILPMSITGGGGSAPYITIDPATGVLSATTAATLRRGTYSTFDHITWTGTLPAELVATYAACDRADWWTWFDYVGDTVVHAIVAVVDTNFPATSALAVVQSPHGLVHTQSIVTTVGGSSMDANMLADNMQITGDLRAELLNVLVPMPDTLPNPGYLVRILKGVVLAATALPGLPAAEFWAYRPYFRYEGCNSSFDGRLIVDRCDDVLRVFVDGTDVTSTMEDLSAVMYPLLCGPLRRLVGVPLKPKKYVAGEPPP